MINEIESCGLTFKRKYSFDYYPDLYIADHIIQNVTFGQYLIMPMSSEEFNGISKDSSCYSDFEEVVLAPSYYRLKGDLGWNLYLCIILEDSVLRETNTQKLVHIERGKKYGKKMILGWGEISERLPAAKIPSKISQKQVVDPLDAWMSVLSPLGLEFCLNEYSEAKFEEYLNNSNRIHHSFLPLIPDRHYIDQRPSGPIISLRFGELFRPHILDKDTEINFAKVNLLHGPNGMGKTSILEGIEMSYTGQIQRNLMAKETTDEKWDGVLSFEEDSNFNGTPDDRERKIREVFYYKHQVSTRARSQLNRLFHQYNYFSSEAVHQFLFNHDAKSDYRSDFARIIFGEQLARTEKNWDRLRDEFRKQKNRLFKKINEIDDMLESIRNQDINSTAIVEQRANSGVKNLNRWISLSRYAYPTLEVGLKLNDIDKWLQVFLPRLSELHILSQPLFDERILELDNQAAALAAFTFWEQNLLELTSKHKDFLSQLQNSPNILLYHEKKKEMETGRNRLTSVKEQLLIFKNRLIEYRYLIDGEAQCERRSSLYEIKNRVIQSISVIDKFCTSYHYLHDKELQITDISVTKKYLAELEKNHMLAWERFTEAATLAKNHSDHTGEVQRLLSELRSSAKHYLTGHETETRCLLCGHDYYTHQLLIETIERGIATDDNTMTHLVNDKELKRLEVVSCKTLLDETSDQIKLYEDMLEAYNVMKNEQENTRLPVTAPFSSENFSQYYMRLIVRLNELKIENKRIDDEILDLENKGFTLKAINELKSILSDSKLNFLNSKEFHTYDTLMILMETKIQSLQDDIENKAKEILELESNISTTTNEKKELQSQIDKNDELILQSSTKVNALSAAIQAFKSLTDNNILLDAKASWKEWRSYFEQLNKEAIALRQILEPIVLIEQKAQQLSYLDGQLKIISEQKEKCVKAEETLSSLRTLAEYADDFVKANFEAISKLFIVLHAPNEFESLELTNENKIIAKRKGKGTTCKVHEMSTGQRTAVILAVFFVMHLVMESAPKFLMLDEPVANMDELNVLGLLDFLRQLAISRDIQIFFTTANPQVATLFRRKFSFFEERFKAYQFYRDPNGPMSIKAQHFTPYQDERPLSKLIKPKLD